jgi:hypothetical protein
VWAYWLTSSVGSSARAGGCHANNMQAKTKHLADRIAALNGTSAA